MVADGESIRRRRGRVVDLGLDENAPILSQTRDLGNDLALQGKTRYLRDGQVADGQEHV